MKVNESYNGFKLIKVKDIDDIGSTMYEFCHEKSGASLVYLENDDTNKCFSIGFRTLPEDSTGICHIIEHSLLCGSKKYPLKEPFVNLLKGSMATFLNAMTACDFTVYPVASQDNKDFFNLVSVYMDAIFAPVSVVDNKPFLQEGWHLEMNDINDTPSYKGVVYNEMKGAMSSVDEQLSQATLEALYKGSCYEYNSGGDPLVIPNLTYEYYQNFYHRFYRPDNGVIYLYGKMNVLEMLEFFDREYLSQFEKSENQITIPVPKALINMDYSKEYEISETEEEKDNTYMSLAFALDTYDNVCDLMGFGILNEALMSTNDSPLKKMLLDAKLGQDIVSTIDDDCILPSYQIFLQKTNPEEKERFYTVFIEACEKLVRDGINKNLLLATINNNEFRNKEMNSGSTPKGLFFAFNLMQSYLYNVPYESYLEYSKCFDYFKKELNNGYFEGLLQKYILNSQHRVETVLLPSKTLAAKRALLMKEKMEELKNKMTMAQKEECVRITKELVAYQSKKDTKEELDTLPTLALSEISEEVNVLPTVMEKDNGYSYILHNFNTNKIAYLKMYFDMNVIPYDDISYVKILCSLLGSLDTEKYSANELQSYIKTYLGELNFTTIISGANKEECVAKLLVNVSALDENISYIPNAMEQILNHTIFDEEKIKVRLLQIQNNVRNQIIESGMSVAMNLARSSASKEGALQSRMSGIRMYRFLNSLTTDYDGKKVVGKLRLVASKLFNKNNLVASLSGSEKTIEELKGVLKNISLNKDALEPLLHIAEQKDSSGALIIPSEVSYNAQAINLKDLGMNYSGKLEVAAHIINYDYLWPEVRVKGGAYGCHLVISKSKDVMLGSYRDPNVSNTYNAYDGVANYLEKLNFTGEEFKTYLIGAIGGYDVPLSNNAAIRIADTQAFTGVTAEKRKQIKKEMIGTTLEDIKEFASLFKCLAQIGPYYTVGNEQGILDFNQFSKVEKL